MFATKAQRLQVSLSHDISSSVNSAIWNMRILGAECRRYDPCCNEPGLSLKGLNLWVHGSCRQAGEISRRGYKSQRLSAVNNILISYKATIAGSGVFDLPLLSIKFMAHPYYPVAES